MNAQPTVYVPDGTPEDAALARTTHLGIGAHPDDLEILAIDGILKCYASAETWFTGVVMTGGGGAPQKNAAERTGADMLIAQREAEQREAARIGRYSSVVFMNRTSSEVKQGDGMNELRAILEQTQPEVVYTHNPMDKHDTHVAALLRVVEAIRALPAEARPRKVYGVEVWRGLDWLPDDRKVIFDCSENRELQQRLIEVFRSQVSVKHYDRAVPGRRFANATYHDAFAPDQHDAVAYALDLTPLTEDGGPTIENFVAGINQAFATDIEERVARHMKR